MFIDVTELLYSLSKGVVTGLQRVQIELLTALCEDAQSIQAPRLFHFDSTTATCHEVAYSDLRQRLIVSRRQASQIDGFRFRSRRNKIVRETRRMWQRRIRNPISRLARRFHNAELTATVPLPDWLKPGSSVFLVGGAWGISGHAEFIHRAREERQLYVVILIYDLIPIRRPELWAGRKESELFATWFARMMRTADLVLTISDFTKREVIAFLKAQPAVNRAITVHRIKLGHGFNTVADRRPSQAPDCKDVVEAAEFVLCVATIEGRKNHGLLLRIWRALLEELGEDTTPRLVLVGRRGWLSDDFFAQLDACEYLGGKIQVIHDCNDQQLRRLYQRCLFTIYPSFYEGWGLPVAEALLAGASCLCSNRTSIPEVAGEAVEYFDPEDGPQALALIRSAIVDPECRVRLRDKARRFRARTWAETAQECLDIIAASRESIPPQPARSKVNGRFSPKARFLS